MKRTGAGVILFVLAMSSRTASAGYVGFLDKVEWLSSTSDVQTIDFLDFPPGTLINDQYASEGITFPSINDLIDLGSSFLNDGAGLTEPGIFQSEGITIQFAQPATAIGVDFVGGIELELYAGDDLVYWSPNLPGGLGLFFGVVSSTPFDRAHLVSPGGGATSIDDLHFALVPGPGCLAPFAWLVLGATCRRRRS